MRGDASALLDKNVQNGVQYPVQNIEGGPLLPTLTSVSQAGREAPSMDTNGVTLSITEARDRLTRLPDELAETHETVTITRHNEPVLAVLPWDLYEAIVETLEVLGEPETMAALRRSVEDIAEGRTIPVETLRERIEGKRSSARA